MAWRLFGAKPLSEPMLTYCQLDSWEQNSFQNTKFFINENAFENPFCPGEDELIFGDAYVWRYPYFV